MVRKTDLGDAQSPEDVAAILYNAADAYYESSAELESAWQDRNAGKEWMKIAKELEQLAAKIERRLK